MQSRPPLGPRLRKTLGALEAHVNGFRFTLPKGEKVDIMYKNIKHAFFQPCEDDLIVLIHFHLKSAIKCGEKLTKDIQFYREVVEAVQDATKGRQDDEEIMEEEEDRRRKEKFNKEFFNFTKRVEESLPEAHQSDFEFDIPFRKLKFQGVPGKEAVDMLPTKDCLVHLTNFPFEVPARPLLLASASGTCRRCNAEWVSTSGGNAGRHRRRVLRARAHEPSELRPRLRLQELRERGD